MIDRCVIQPTGRIADPEARIKLLPLLQSPGQPYIAMRREFLTVIERVDGTHVASCPEIPGIVGRGRTKMAALVDLRQSVSQSLKERRESGIREATKEAVFDTISVES